MTFERVHYKNSPQQDPQEGRQEPQPPEINSVVDTKFDISE